VKRGSHRRELRHIARQSSCDLPPGSCPAALSFGVGWDHGGGPCMTSRRSQSVRIRHLLLTPARSGSAARARASVLCVAPSAKSRAYAARSSSKGAPSSSDVGGGAPFAAARRSAAAPCIHSRAVFRSNLRTSGSSALSAASMQRCARSSNSSIDVGIAGSALARMKPDYFHPHPRAGSPRDMDGTSSIACTALAT
jgi:hypothetical protein